MNTKSKKGRVLLVSALLVAGAGTFYGATQSVSAETTPPSDAGIVPVLVEGNPTCGTLDPNTIEFKISPTGGDGTPVLSGQYTDGTLVIDLVVNDNKEVAWTSNIGVDSVFVKGGPQGNFYVYDPPTESFGDSGLFAPDNASGGPAGLSHVSFCYDIELGVTKTANTSFTRTWNWTIDKSVDPTDLNLFHGQTGSVAWTVAVTKSDPVDSDWAVEGDITITNPANTSAHVTSVVDSLSGFGVVSTDCTAPFDVAAHSSVVCHYQTGLPNGSNRTNTATVLTSGGIGGGAGSAPVIFGAPTTEVNPSINVEDTVAGDLGSFTGSGSVTYTQNFTCNQDSGSHSNTATIVETGANDTATTNVHCYDLTVTKNARTSDRRVFDWSLNKSANFSSITLMPNDVLPVTFTVNVSALSHLDNFAVAGSITIHNPAPISVNLVSVVDSISGVGNVAVDCGTPISAATPYLLGAGADLVCAYLSALPDGTDRVNTATATTEFGVDYVGTAPVSFANADQSSAVRCVSIADSNYPALAALFDAADGTVDGQFCVGVGQTTASFQAQYTLNLSFPNCGPTQYSNTVDLSTGQTTTVIIPVNVPCATGCTLTIGYWKTHSSYGPAKADPNWFLIGDVDGDGVSEGPNETFFTSGKTWYQVFNTPPAGNPYYIAAVQYMGARLNIANGASSTPAVTSALAAAKTFFQTYGPSTSWTKAQKTQLTDWGTLFNSYNTGAVGPGHCSEII